MKHLRQEDAYHTVTISYNFYRVLRLAFLYSSLLENLFEKILHNEKVKNKNSYALLLLIFTFDSLSCSGLAFQFQVLRWLIVFLMLHFLCKICGAQKTNFLVWPLHKGN